MEYNDSDSTKSSDASPAAERLSRKESNSPTTGDLSPPVSPGYLPVSPPRNDSDSTTSSDPGKTLFPIAEEKKKRKLPAQEKDQNDQKFAHKYGAEERRKKKQELAAWKKPWENYGQDDKKFSHKHVAPDHDTVSLKLFPVSPLRSTAEKKMKLRKSDKERMWSDYLAREETNEAMTWEDYLSNL